MLELYILETCPYCQKVMQFLDENKIDYAKHNIEKSSELNELKLIGGKEQVPYLFDPKNKIGMYESDNIINYIKSFYLLSKYNLHL